MLMMLPLPRPHIAGPNSWHGSRKPPTRLRSNTLAQPGSGIFSNGISGVTTASGWLPPAALSSTVGAPSAWPTASWHDLRLAGSIASQAKNCASPPASAISCTRASPRSALRPATATLAPALAIANAQAPPNAPVAPITTATSPLKSNKFSDMAAQSPPASRLVEGNSAGQALGQAAILRLRGGKISDTIRTPL